MADADARLAQAPRLLAIETPLGPDALVLRGLSVSEAISRPFLIEATVLARRAEVSPADLIGKAVTCSLRRPSCPERHFHGVVRSFSKVGLMHRSLAEYRLEAVPRLWNLSRTADCRVFQNMSVPDIVRAVVEEGAAAPLSFATEPSQTRRPYTVQYNETDLDFVQRLLDEIGCGYFFRHERGQHTMVVTAANAGFPSVADGPLVVREDGGDSPEALTEWREARRAGPTSAVALDYDMLKPSQLLRDAKGAAAAPGGEWEVFRWPGGQAVRPDAQPARLDLEAAEGGGQVLAAAGSAPGVFAGGKLAVRLALGGATENFVVTEVRHDAHDDTHLVSSGGGAGYRNALSLIPVARTWRNPAPRPRTALPGVQSAIVTGPQGEEVHCDEYGRIRLRFLWDRKGERDDRSSCWVRVAQPWAGKGRGFWALPRIGDEVLVAFVDGDADRPVVIGSLYNAEADPPFPLPANATQTGILTRSSKGGSRSNANMLRFEDKKGSEEVALTAERDLTVDVERDATETVKRNRSATVAEGDDTLEVRQGDISVKAAAGTITLEAAQRITLKVGSTEVVLDQMSVSIKTGQVSVKGDMMVRVESGGNLIEKAGAIVQVNGALIKLN